jgi:hypothetical protein
MTPQEIADSLSPKVRDALCGRYSWESPIEEQEGEAVLYRLGLWNPKPKYGEGVITARGILVRAIVLPKKGRASPRYAVTDP